MVPFYLMFQSMPDNGVDHVSIPLLPEPSSGFLSHAGEKKPGERDRAGRFDTDPCARVVSANHPLSYLLAASQGRGLLRGRRRKAGERELFPLRRRNLHSGADRI
jgi:hypothetical protein